MKLYSGRLSLFGRKTEIALREKGLDYDCLMVPFTQGEGYSPRDPRVMAANPKGQVPVLVDGDLTLFDSTVILEYLEDAYPTPPLFPKAPAARARCRLLELYGDEVLLAPVRALMFRNGPWPSDPVRRAAEEEKAKAAEPLIDGHFADLERRLDGQDYLCGAFSAADIAVFMPVHYSRRLGGPPLRAHPRLAAWYERLAKRPSFAGILADIAAADAELSLPVAGAFR